MKASDRRRRTLEVTPVADLIGTVLEGYRLSDEVRGLRIQTEWERIVGDRLAARTRPGTVAEGVLPVRVSNSSWMHQLSFLRDDLVARINQALGDPPLVQSIRLHLGGRGGEPRPEDASSRRRTRRSARRRLEPAIGEGLARIEAEAASVEDLELRAVILEARRRVGR